MSIEAKVDALTRAVQELRAGQERILAAIEGRAPVELPPLTAVDVAPYLRVIAVDDPDDVADDGDLGDNDSGQA